MADVQVCNPCAEVDPMWNNEKERAASAPGHSNPSSKVMYDSRASFSSASCSRGLTASPSRDSTTLDSEVRMATQFLEPTILDSPRPRHPSDQVASKRIVLVAQRNEPLHHIAEKKEKKCLLPPVKPGIKLTVVFDLDETLICNRQVNRVIPRPYYHAVLQGLRSKPDVELVLWTASTIEIVNRVMDEVHEGAESVFDHIIARNDQWFTQPTHTKDLRLLGRDMNRVVIIENSINCCKLNPLNSILVENFFGNDTDASLVNVYYMLEATLHLISDKVTVAACLKTLAKEHLLCNWFELELPIAWKRVDKHMIPAHRYPPSGRFIKALTTYNVS